MLEEIEKDSHALKPLFDVTLCDENDQPLSWSKGLVQSTNYPTFSFTVEDQQTGTTRGYTGWTLPESLNLSMLETREHDLEKYLLDWAFGEHGIFNLETSTFRAADKESWLFRQVIIRTTYYEVKNSGHLDHAAIDIGALAEYAITTIVDSLSDGKVTLSMRQEIQEAAREFASFAIENKQPLPNKEIIYNKQIIPVADKLVSVVNTLVNQLATRVPIAGSVVPPLTIPPPIMKVPATLNLNVSSMISSAMSNVFNKPPSLTSLSKNAGSATSFNIRQSASSRKSTFKAADTSVGRQAVKDCIKKVDEILKNLPKGEAEEKATSTNMHRVALRSYTVENYDYSSGGPVSYSLDLPLVDFSKPDFS